MAFHATRRGAAIVGLWLVLAGALAAFLLSPGGWAPVLLAVWAAAVFGGLVPRLASARLYIGRHHVSARWAFCSPLCAAFPGGSSQAATFWRRRSAAWQAYAC